MAAIQSRDAAVKPLLRSDPQSALRLSLTDPPYATKTAAVKEASFEVVGKALVAIKEADIEAAVSALSLDECDVLMKYLYRGFGMEGREKLYPALLKWHPVVLRRAGQASIVRAISEVQRGL